MKEHPTARTPWRSAWIAAAFAACAALAGGSALAQTDTDLPGSDYKNFDLDSPRPELCEAACNTEAECVAYTYVKPDIQGPNARCWLKNGLPDPVADTCCISGVKVHLSQGPVARSPGLASALLFRHTDGRLAVLPMKGTVPLLPFPNFEQKIWVISQEAQDWKVSGTGDFNNDGHGDLFWQRDDGLLNLWQMEGTAILTKGVTGATLPALPGLESPPLFGDMNVDGITDLVWNGKRPRKPGEIPPDGPPIIDSNVVYLEQAWLMQAGTTVPAATENRASTIWATAALGQFDALGPLDRLRRSFDGRSSFVLASGVEKTGPQLSRAWLLKGVGDFDDDGSSDVLFQHGETGELQVWKVVDGVVVRTVVLQAVPVAVWQIQGLADTDGDGRSDIVWRNTTGDLSVWRMGDAITVADYGAVIPIDPAWTYAGALPVKNRMGGTWIGLFKYVPREVDCVDETMQAKGAGGAIVDIPVAKYPIPMDSGQWYCRYNMDVLSYLNIAGAYQLVTQFNGTINFNIMPDLRQDLLICPSGATCKDTPAPPPPPPPPVLVYLPIWGGLTNYFPGNGEPIWYYSTFPEPNINRPPGRVLSIRALQDMNIPTQGNTTLDCTDPSKIISVRYGETLSGDRLAAVYGTAEPKTKIGIPGCLTRVVGTTVNQRMAVEVTYQPD